MRRRFFWADGYHRARCGDSLAARFAAHGFAPFPFQRDVWEHVAAGRSGLLHATTGAGKTYAVYFVLLNRVLQIGSAKGVARLLQRAGRSGHAPGRVSRITFVPTRALELIEAAASRDAATRGVLQGRVESRQPPDKPLDVLVQHLVTVALGPGFDEADLLAEVRSTVSYAQLTDAEWNWALDFAGRGGESLRAYPEYRRIALGDDGRWIVPDPQIARRHRMSVGTIVADSTMVVSYRNGAKVGTIEESFIARLRRGDRFRFGGRVLELMRVQDMTAFVSPANGRDGAVPRGAGARMAFSSEMACCSHRRNARYWSRSWNSRACAPRSRAARPAGRLTPRDAADAVRVRAAGGGAARAAQHREAGGAHRAHGARTRAACRRGVAPKKRYRQNLSRACVTPCARDARAADVLRRPTSYTTYRPNSDP